MAPLYVIVCPIICFEVSGVLDIEDSACESINIFFPFAEEKETSFEKVPELMEFYNQKNYFVRFPPPTKQSLMETSHSFY